MKAELRVLHSPDLDDLQHGSPPDPSNFGILVQAMIGPEDEEGEESFDIVVCTPTWMANKVAAEGYAWGRHHLLIPRYDYPTIRDAVRALCHSVEGSDWRGVATALARYGAWEFEDYEG
jgi:hypothetical protein